MKQQLNKNKIKMSTSAEKATPNKEDGFIRKVNDFFNKYYQVMFLGAMGELCMLFPFRFIGLFRPVLIDVCPITQKELALAQSVEGMVAIPGVYIYIYIYIFIYNK